MDTNRLDWMQIGQVVAIHGAHWRGVITDIAISEKGVIMICVASPKGLFYGTPPEWLEYYEGGIAPCSDEALKAECEHWQERTLERAKRISEFYRGAEK